MALPALLSTDDLVKFRTRFCERFLQFGECNFGGKCQYSHNMTWRRRSPQKYLYEPRLCENIVWLVSDAGLRRQTIGNCHNGKNCKFAHSREEILYHPLIYKTVMCEDMTCGKFYCPFAHSMEELLPAAEAPEYIRRCLIDAAALDESDADLLDDGDLLSASGGADGEIALLDGSLRLRKASGCGNSIPAAPRLHLPVPGSAEWSNAQTDPSAWVSISGAIRIETVIRARSPVVASELCRALVSRTDTAGLAAKKITPPSGLPSQYCLAKVIQVPAGSSAVNQLVQELQTISKTEHRNLVTVKRVHVGTIPSGGQMVVLALEQGSTSLAQAVVDGYRSDGTVRGLARKLNPHNGTTTMAACQRISDLVAGLQRLHFIGSAHGRLCPSNILIDAEAGFKIADFMGKLGLLYVTLDGDSSAGKSYLEDQQVSWQAPELTRFLRGKDTKSVPDLRKCDVFSLGCVVFYAMTGQHPFGSSSENIVENIQADFVTNQHLLYSCPLVLDLCMRCLSNNPEARIDVNELSRHPLFWDFDMTRNALFSAPLGDEFLSKYELRWKEMAGSVAETGPYDESVSGAIKFLVDAWSSMNHVSVSSLWVKVLDAFPQILVRVWDSHRKHASAPVFERNHLHWMSLRSSATTCISHQFVREYYAALTGFDDVLPDESANLSDACNALAAGIAGKLKASQKPSPARLLPIDRKFRPPPAPTGSPVVTPSPTSVAGMTFVDPMIVKQMAAASAALSAVYDNPELVTAITKGEPTPYNQLVATASIYSSLLDEAGVPRHW
jgi:serine/threonine protein kinase